MSRTGHSGPGARHTSEPKHEPVVHSINPKAVAQLGTSIYQGKEPMSAGRGFTAPQPSAKTIHHGGSQGKHK